MTDVKIDVEDEAVATVKQDEVVDGRLVEQLIGRAREQGVALTGDAGRGGELAPGGDHSHDLGGFEVSGEDVSEGFLESVGVPEQPAGVMQPGEGGLLLLGQILRVFQ